MVNSSKIYKSRSTGLIVSPIGNAEEMLKLGSEDLQELPEMSPELEGKEKHVPLVEIEGNKITVTVGSVHHPMDDDHFIEFVQLLKGDKVIAERRLYPSEKPVAVFYVEDAEGIRAREFCNKHGLWSSN